MTYFQLNTFLQEDEDYETLNSVNLWMLYLSFPLASSKEKYDKSCCTNP